MRWMIKPVVESLPEAIVDLTEETLIRVLHVDDDADFLNTAKQILEMQSSFQVETARSVEEAKDKMKEKTFDVIVSDYVMPGKNGLEFLKELKDSGSNIPFIIFTGKGREEIAIKALNLGADAYFNKLGHPETVYGELAHGIRCTVKSKQAEQALKESEEKYHSLFANMLNGFAYCRMIFDEKDKPIDFVYLEVNDAFEKLTGLKKEDVIGKKVTEAIPGTEKANPELLDIYSRVALTRKEEEFEIFFKPLNMWLSISVYSPKKGYFVAVFENITERKQAEEALKGSEEKFRNLVELSPDTIAVHREGKIVYVNAAGAKFLHAKNPEQLIGKSIMDFLHPSFRGIVKKRVQQIEEEGKQAPLIEEKFIRLDETVVDVEVAAIPFTHNGKPATIAITRDITERKKAEEQLRSNVLILENITDSIIVTDLEGRITSWNEGASKIFGFSAEEMLGETIAKVSKPAEREQVAPAQLEQIRTGVLFFGEWEGVKKDGEPVWLMLTTKLLKNSQGETIGMIGVGKDITERKKAEENLRFLKEFNERIVNSICDALLVIDPYDYTIISANEVALTQLKLRKEDVIGKTCYETTHHSSTPCKLPNHISPIQEMLETGEAVTVEHTHFDRNNNEIYVEVSAHPMRNQEGKIAQAVHLARNITERKQAEERVKKASEDWKKTFDAISDFVFIIDTDFRLVKVNRSLCNALKKEPEELIGKRRFEVLHGTDKPWPTCPNVQTLATKVAATEEIDDPNLGISLLVTISPILDDEGELTGCVHVAKDITERKKVEKALLEAEEKYRKTIVNANVGIITYGPEGEVKVFNPKMEEMTGFKRTEIPTLVNWFEKLYPNEEERRKVRDKWFKRMSEEGEVKEGHAIITTKEGKRRNFLFNAVQLESGDSIAFAHDITERKLADKSLNRIIEELATTNDKLNVVDRLTRHDVRNKLSAVLNNIYLAKKTLTGDHEALKYLGDIESVFDQVGKIFEFAEVYEQLGTEALSYVDVSR